MRLLVVCSTSVAFSAILLLAGCISCSTRQNPDDLREKTAQATANLKQDTKAVAQGIKEGLSSGKYVDINTASRGQLTALPGITDDAAERIIGARPYESTRQLVTKHVLSQREYDKIADRVTVKNE